MGTNQKLIKDFYESGLPGIELKQPKARVSLMNAAKSLGLDDKIKVVERTFYENGEDGPGTLRVFLVNIDVVEELRAEREAQKAKTVPDDILILDRLIYAHGNEAEIESWNQVKRGLKNAAHSQIAA